MPKTPRQLLTWVILNALFAFAAGHPVHAQFMRFGAGQQNGGGGQPRPPGPGFNTGGMNMQPGRGVPGGGGQRGGGLLDQLFINGGASPGGNNRGQFRQMPNQNVSPEYLIDPNTGQYVQFVPGNNMGQIQQPGQQQPGQQQPVMTQTRVYDVATNRVFIQETNQPTGEMWDPVNQRPYWPAPAAEATTAVAAQPAARPAEPPKPVGPPRNTFMGRLKVPAESTRRQIRGLIRSAYENFLVDDLEAALRPGLFSDADRERLLGLVERKDGTTADQIENLTNAIDQLDAHAVRLKLDAIQVGRDQYPGVIERIALSGRYQEFCEDGFQTASKTKQSVKRLVTAATKAGLPRDLLRSVTQRLEAFSRINEELDEPDVGDEGLDLASVSPETVFTVVRWRGFTANIPVLLASETLLLPLNNKGSGTGKLTIETLTALEVGWLPIYGSLNAPVPDASANVPTAPAGVTFRVDPQAGADVTFYVTDETGKVVIPQTLKPGVTLPFPDRTNMQMALPDGRGGFSPWEPVGPGTYVLSLQGGVWQKALEPSVVVIDNTANAFPFNYRIAGADGTVPARQSIAINRPTNLTPIEFHRGQGDRVATKLLSGRDGRFVVRAATTGQLDLFEPDDPLPDSPSALADARAVPAATGSPRHVATPRSATPSASVLDRIRPRFPVGTLDE